MQINVDTHALVKILENAQFNETQAEAIVEVFNTTNNSEKILNLQKQESITTEKLANTKEKLQNNEEVLKGVATKEFVKTEIKSTKEFVKTEIAQVRTEIEQVRTEIEQVRTEIEQVRTEIKSSANSQIRWIVGVILTVSTLQVGVLVFVLKLFFNNTSGT